jgi:hypothetical protein
MADDDETVVVLEGEQATEATKDGDRLRNPDGTFAPVAKAEEPAADLADQFKALQAEAEGNRHAREQAERRAAALEQEALRARHSEARAQSQVASSYADTVAAGMAAAEAEIASAKKALRAAKEAGDYEQEVEALDGLTAARGRLQRLDEAKSDIEARRAQAGEQSQRRAEAPDERRASIDPERAFLETRSDATRNWLRAHPEYSKALALHLYGGASTEQSRRALKIQAADTDALAEGIERDTPAYFSHIEAYVARKDAATANGATPQPPPQAKRRPSVPVAPVQASAGGTNGGGVEVRLSKAEYAAATDGTLQWNYDDPSPQKRFRKGDPIGAQEFAKRKIALQKSGAYDKSYTEGQ